MSPQFHQSIHSRYCLFTLSSSFRGPHFLIKLFHACKIRKVDKDVIRGSHKQLCINSTRWDFEPTLIWIQMDGHNSRESRSFPTNGGMSLGVTLGAKLTSFPSIDPGTRSFMNEWLAYILVHKSVPCEQQVSLHTDSWHHSPKLHTQEEPSNVTCESSNPRCRPPQWDSLKNLVLFHQNFLLNRRLFPFHFAEGISSFGFWQFVCNLLPSDRWHHIDCMA